jgi:pSer/pThr/pTyr-binding forkhead associated (FHA) protein
MTSPEAGTRSNAYIINEFERRAYPITDEPVRVGRDASNDIVLRESAVSRFQAEIRRENEKFVLHSTGSIPASVDGVVITAPHPLSEGGRIQIGSAILTFTEQRLPIGVSIIERAGRPEVLDDVANRRDTIKHPLLKMPLSDEPPGPYTRAKILLLVAGLAVLLYVVGR